MTRSPLLIALTGLLISSSAWASDACHSFIDKEHAHIIAVLHDTQAGYAQKKAELTRIFNESVDADWLARFVAGAYWQKASDAQRGEYVKVYRDFITHNYIGTLDEDDIKSFTDLVLVEFKPLGGPNYEARARIEQKDDEPIILDLKLTEVPAGVCHVRDFSVEGVSLLAIQHDEMEMLGQSGGLPAITKTLKEHTPH